MGVLRKSYSMQRPVGIAVVFVLALVGAGLVGLTEPTCGCLPAERAAPRAMSSDLRNLVGFQNSHFDAHGTYTTSVGDYFRDFGRGWSRAIVTIDVASESGWSATARDTTYAVECTVFGGDAAVPTEGAAENTPTCRTLREKGLLTRLLEPLGRRPKS